MSAKFGMSGPPFFDATIGDIHIVLWRYPDAHSTEFVIVNRHYNRLMYFTQAMEV